MNDGVSIGANLAQSLGSAIIRGDYRPGQNLPTEHALSEKLGVGRGAVREAIKVLASKGLVESRRRQGTVINPVRSWSLLDPDILGWMREVEYSHRLLFELVQVRQAIEPEACAMVARRAAMVDFRPMEQAIERMADTNIDEAGLLAADTAFHLSILRATGNRFFSQFEHLFSTTLAFGYELIELYKFFETDRKINVAEHRQILDLMRDGDAQQVRRANRDMIAITVDKLVDLMETNS